ncbi:hypothetical protein B0H16DRAFT_1886452 [Mycena metata]|uniref:Uncharacterized protein n=1 Tax=Mycena metata TaxID=1033252 RepID=A0AAD7NCM1_9AGAR|nr:hypothetical protein B0H16DRAFT_1886452 [Mycena metata]
MPFADSPTLPAQTHPVRFQSPSLLHLSIWAYLALAFIIITTIGVLCYAAYSFHYSLTLNATMTPLPQYKPRSKASAKRSKKKAWRPSTSRSSQQQPMLSEMSMEDDSSYEVNRRMNLTPLEHASPERAHVSPITYPSVAAAATYKPRAVQYHDMHNIPFASPSNVAIYSNPKLAPVLGSAVPLSYDSHNNLFANPFTPVTSAKTVSGKGSIASFSSVFRGKGKGRSSQGGKENSKVQPSQAEAIPMKCMYQ